MLATRPTLRRMRISLLVWLAVLVVLTGIVRAGSPFIYCHAMGTFQSHCCCPRAEQDAPKAPAMSVEMPCCCERGAISSLPEGASSPMPERPSAPLVAMLAPVKLEHHLLAASVTQVAPRGYVHSTSPPRSAAARCSRLSVFLI